MRVVRVQQIALILRNDRGEIINFDRCVDQ